MHWTDTDERENPELWTPELIAAVAADMDRGLGRTPLVDGTETRPARYMTALRPYNGPAS